MHLISSGIAVQISPEGFKKRGGLTGSIYRPDCLMNEITDRAVKTKHLPEG
jgi:hypothetical protein